MGASIRAAIAAGNAKRMQYSGFARLPAGPGATESAPCDIKNRLPGRHPDRAVFRAGHRRRARRHGGARLPRRACGPRGPVRHVRTAGRPAAGPRQFHPGIAARDPLPQRRRGQLPGRGRARRRTGARSRSDGARPTPRRPASCPREWWFGLAFTPPVLARFAGREHRHPNYLR